MITSLKLKNYRNLLLEEGITFDPLTIFVGPNGSGKTNLLRVLRYFKESITDEQDDKRGVTSFEKAIQNLGLGRILDFRLEPPSRVKIELEYCYYDPFADEEYKVLRLSEHLLVKNEHTVTQDTSEIHFTKPAIDDTSTFEEVHEDMYKYLSSCQIYHSSNINLETIRTSSPSLGSNVLTLSTTFDNLALVLYNLTKDHIDNEDRIREAMTELFPATRSLRAVVVGRTSLSIAWYLKGLPKPIYLDEMSDGTLLMLSWAILLLSPKPPPLIIIEEPETHLHPAWLRPLAGWIREASRRTQVIISTHSSDLLDYFTEDAGSVRVFEPDPENPLYTRVRPLDPKSIEDKIAEGWKLGDIYRVGDPNIGGWPW